MTLDNGSNRIALKIDCYTRAANTAGPSPRTGYEPVKRVIDCAGAAFGLIFFLPLMCVICALVALDGGPVFFAHRRIGRNGAPFKCYKFRSMVIDAERRLADHLATNPAAHREWERTFKLTDDPRITRIGAFLRKTSLDELPQLFNVLKGDMSLVGPRPIVEAELDRYGDHVHLYLSCRPGVTGLWQVSGRSDCSYEERVAMDCAYVLSSSLRTDAVIILRTAGVVVARRGAR